jgi:FKBP-type peptidyl-prolyl cis-trans isomerase FkpA
MRLIIFFILAIVLFSCKDEKQPEPDIDWDLNKSSEINKVLAQRQEQRITGYFKRRNLEYKFTDLGLYYVIKSEGEGDTIKSEDIVEIEFEVSLLDGTFCYSSDSSENHVFIVDKDHTESGLHEGIKLLKPNSSATFVLPSHLAYGLLGDREKIPGNTEIAIDLKVVRVNDK